MPATFDDDRSASWVLQIVLFGLTLCGLRDAISAVALLLPPFSGWQGFAVSLVTMDNARLLSILSVSAAIVALLNLRKLHNVFGTHVVNGARRLRVHTRRNPIAMLVAAIALTASAALGVGLITRSAPQPPPAAVVKPVVPAPVPVAPRHRHGPGWHGHHYYGHPGTSKNEMIANPHGTGSTEVPATPQLETGISGAVIDLR